MKSFLGIHSKPRNESDDEYVKRIRKQDRTRKKLAWLWPVISVLNLATMLAIAFLVQLLAEKLTVIKEFASAYKAYFWSGFFLGILFGVWAGLVVIKAALDLKHWRDAKHGFRTEQLLLKYYDLASR
jgi:general stress protein CsbA